MRTYKLGGRRFISGLLAAVALILLLAEPGNATTTNKSVKAAVTYSSISAAYRQGMGAFHAGQLEIAIPALEYAAHNNILKAQLWLARIHSRGLKKAEIDNIKAYKYYQFIANRLADIKYYQQPYASYAAEAFVALAFYHKTGLPQLQMKSNHEAAVRLYWYAAVNLRDATAQYNIARAHLKGQGVPKSLRGAYRFFSFAAKQNHAPAQASLGKLLWQGKVKREKDSKAKGLALLILAHRNATKGNQGWIGKLHHKYVSKASAKLIAKANRYVDSWEEQFGGRVKTMMVIRRKKVDPNNATGLATNENNDKIFAPVKPVNSGVSTGITATPTDNKGKFQNLGTVPADR